MIIARIEGFTRELGKSQGFRGLPIKDDKMDDGSPVMISAWEPTPQELAMLNAGGKVMLSILGVAHPPVSLQVLPPEWARS